MKRPVHQLRVPADVARLIQNLHPGLKRKVYEALQQILTDPHSGKVLKDELEGLRSFRVGRFRIVYRIATGRRIDLVAVGPRAVIYEETYRRITKTLHHRMSRCGPSGAIYCAHCPTRPGQRLLHPT